MKKEKNKTIFEVNLKSNGDCIIDGNAKGTEICTVIAHIVDSLANKMTDYEDDYLSNVKTILKKVEEILAIKFIIKKL